MVGPEYDGDDYYLDYVQGKEGEMLENGAEVDPRNFVQVTVHIPAGLYHDVRGWLNGGGNDSIPEMSWGQFIEMAWATVPWVKSAYEEYIKAYSETPELKRTPEVMSLDDFAHHQVYEWFK